jgi:soluble lytic murein transglycosylase-like protein
MPAWAGFVPEAAAHQAVPPHPPASPPPASAAPTPQASRQAELLLSIPSVLSSLDASRYAATFALQEEANWKAADAEIAHIKDRALIGSVLAQRYLSAGYRTSFAEARDWLDQYADQPEARAIWLLAKSRAPGKTLPHPVAAADQVATPIDPELDATRAASRLPAEPQSIGLHAPPGFEAGIRNWRAKRWAEASQNFEAVARASSTSSWYVAAAAFWAARGELMLRDPEKVDEWFELAAAQPRSFYGLLAQRTLGLEPDLKFGPKPLTGAEMAQLYSLPGGRRALALVQVGETDRAEAELRALSTRGNRNLADAIVALADIANMPSLCLALGNQTSGAARSDDALYPVPKWQPRAGFSVDRALLFALMMEESRFNALAHSGSGAAGLMQLMPETARSVARQAGFPLHGVTELVDPVVNLSLGQEYVKTLIGHQQVNGNLILLLAAYKTGPGPLAKLATPEQEADPLLFLESLPRQDTRIYVEQVLTNLWIYRQRLDQPVPDLDALAANRWPNYVSMEAAAAPPRTQNAAYR